MSDELLVVHDGGSVAGAITQAPGGKRSFRYQARWRRWDGAIALSLSLPLGATVHAQPAIDSWMWGLLPDNELVLERWAREHHVSSRNPFGLLQYVGEDCAGAFQLVTRERLDSFSASRGPQVTWIDEAEVGARLAAVRADPSRTRTARDDGQFSLAGAQPKIALLRDGERWGVPAGRTPTTHILKPPTGDFDGFAENEHFCLRLARMLGLPVVTSEVARFGDEIALVTERYDRASTARLAAAASAEAAALATEPPSGDIVARAAAKSAQAATLGAMAAERPFLRLHQEDLCQALGVHPARKYQNEGGPSPAEIVQLLRSSSSDPQADVATFVDSLALSWLLGATDAHAKNYALLHAPRGRVRLAPLYDIVSALPYHELGRRKLRLAMSIGGEYRIATISRPHVEKLATALRLGTDDTLARFRAIAERAPDAASDVARALRDEGLAHSVIARLADEIAGHARWCAKRLRAAGPDPNDT